MLIKLKNKDTLIIDDFKFRCSIGRGGLKKDKFEGDKATPKGIFSLGELYYRSDRVEKPTTKIITNKITKNMVWCNDSNSKYYNSLTKVNKNYRYEKLYRNDFKYNYFILVKYNYLKPKKNKGSAIFIHLTKNYKPTAGCIALKKKDFLIFAKIIRKNSKIIIN